MKYKYMAAWEAALYGTTLPITCTADIRNRDFRGRAGQADRIVDG